MFAVAMETAAVLYGCLKQPRDSHSIAAHLTESGMQCECISSSEHMHV